MESSDKELFLESVRNEIAHIGPHLQIISQRVIEEGISEYPVFIASQQIIDIGKPIFDRDSVQLNWFFNASILEDFVRKGIVNREKVHEFTQTFGDPSKKACIFVVVDDQGQFVFVPYDIEES